MTDPRSLGLPPPPLARPAARPRRAAPAPAPARARCSSAPGSKRTPKDPSAFADIEALRRELEQSTGQPAFTITRTIAWLSKAANSGGESLAFKAYRFVFGLDQSFDRGGWVPPGHLQGPALAAAEARVDPQALAQLQAVLLISRPAALRLLARCPAAAAMPAGELAARVVGLKGALPGADAARLVELLPSAFLGPAQDAWPAVLAQVAAAAAELQEGLPGADVGAMCAADPTVLFESPASLRAGVRRLRELWDVGAAALAASEPGELALAVRALGLEGPPRSM